MNRKTQVVCGVPGIGKTTLAKSTRWRSVDLEPMGFKWIQSSLNMAWPRNYVDAIMELCGQVDLILVSSHPEVITELLNRGVDVTLVYPDETQKKEYHQRHLNRGDPQWLVDFFADNFDLFIVAARNQPGSRDIVLQPGQHLTDVISRIIKT